MRYAEIKQCDIANGTGVRTSLFVSGCRRKCPGCFNLVAWDFGYGYDFTPEVEGEIVDSLRPSYVAGLSLLGGEPMEPENRGALLRLLRRVREELPEKDVWTFSGFTWEELLEGDGSDPAPRELLELIDVLVDGPYVGELHDITLRFHGSSNQRVIDVPASLAAGRVIEWSDDPVFAKRGMEGWVSSTVKPAIA